MLNYTISLLVEPDARNYSWRRFDQLSGAMRTLEREKSSKNTRQIGNPFHPFFVLHHQAVLDMTPKVKAGAKFVIAP